MLAEATTATANRSDVIAALKQASAATGSNFDYLLGTAMRESSLKPSAQASTSSAAGLFQFTQQTWLGMIKQHGAAHGLGSYANAITQDDDGRYHVTDKADRSAILGLRNDPKTAALMAGEYANDSRCEMEGRLGRSVCNGELYAAHFLGPDAACRLIRLNNAKPDSSAADAFPEAADANRNVFYHRDGSPKTVHEVYNWALKQPAGNGSAMIAGTARVAHAPAPAVSPSSLWSEDQLAYNLTDASGQSDLSLGLLGGAPNARVALTPGIMHILASLTPPDLDKPVS